MSKINKFSYNPQLWKEANIDIIANRVKSALLDSDVIPQIRQCIAKSVPLDTPEFYIGQFGSIVFKMTAVPDDNGLETGGCAVVNIYVGKQNLTYRYVDIRSQKPEYDIAEVVFDTIEFLRNHGEKKSYTADNGPELS